MPALLILPIVTGNAIPYYAVTRMVDLHTGFYLRIYLRLKRGAIYVTLSNRLRVTPQTGYTRLRERPRESFADSACQSVHRESALSATSDTWGKYMRVAVVGATGAVGKECLYLLEHGDLPVDHVTPIASAASAGRDLRAELGLTLSMGPVTAVEDADIDSLDVAIFCAGAETSLREAERFTSRGVLVVDNSSAFRGRDDVPLVVPEVNPEALAERPESNLVANPNCSTIQMVRALHPIHRLAGLEQVIVSTYQSASGGGYRGLAELTDESARRLADMSSPMGPSGRFGQPLAFNLVPQIGLTDDEGWAHEERKLAREPKKIMGLPNLRVSATAVRVPVFDCHSEAVHVRTAEPLTAEAVEDALSLSPRIRVYRGAEQPNYPMPRVVALTDEDRARVHVGRIRVDPDDDHAVWLWIVADNLWVGAALNAVEIISTAVKATWLG